jgi:hypothetical protein
LSAGDLAAVIVSFVMIAAIVVIALVASSMLRTLRELRSAVADLRHEALPLLGELRDTVSAAGAEVDRVDDLLESAEAISARVDSASRLGYLAFRAPIIRVVAVGRGVGRGARRLVARPPARPGLAEGASTTMTRRDRSRSGPRAA